MRLAPKYLELLNELHEILSLWHFKWQGAYVTGTKRAQLSNCTYAPHFKTLLPITNKPLPQHIWINIDLFNVGLARFQFAIKFTGHFCWRRCCFGRLIAHATLRRYSTRSGVWSQRRIVAGYLGT